MNKPELTYQGRPLPLPEDEVVDQGLAFDLQTLFSRRRALRFLGLGAAGGVLVACGANDTSTGATEATTAPATATGEIPEETAGPYPGDGSNGPDVLEQSGVVRKDIRSSFGTGSGTADGVPMTLELVISDLSKGGSPYAGVAVYIWHCDRAGLYSLYSQGVENENYLRGVQIADTNGRVSFTSIFPACYDGRWPHIHFEVYPDQPSITDATKTIATSQVALPQNICETVYAQPGYEKSIETLKKVTLTTDMVFREDNAAHQLATVTGDITTGYKVTLNVAINPTTQPASGRRPR